MTAPVVTWRRAGCSVGQPRSGPGAVGPVAGAEGGYDRQRTGPSAGSRPARRVEAGGVTLWWCGWFSSCCGAAHEACATLVTWASHPGLRVMTVRVQVDTVEALPSICVPVSATG